MRYIPESNPIFVKTQGEIRGTSSYLCHNCPLPVGEARTHQDERSVELPITGRRTEVQLPSMLAKVGKIRIIFGSRNQVGEALYIPRWKNPTRMHHHAWLCHH
jgi:hypothetical protein